MSYVRMTKSVVVAIRDKVNDLKDTELQNQERPDVVIGTPLYDDLVRVALEAIWSEAPDIKDKMPDNWCRTQSQVSVSFRGKGMGDVIQLTLWSPEDHKVRLPPDYSNWNDIEVTHEHMTPAIVEWLSARYEEESKRQETIDMFDAIETELTDFLNRYASLNTAIKDMAELEVYIPDEYMIKLKDKTNKPKATPKTTFKGVYKS